MLFTLALYDECHLLKVNLDLCHSYQLHTFMQPHIKQQCWQVGSVPWFWRTSVLIDFCKSISITVGWSCKLMSSSFPPSKDMSTTLKQAMIIKALGCPRFCNCMKTAWRLAWDFTELHNFQEFSCEMDRFHWVLGHFQPCTNALIFC